MRDVPQFGQRIEGIQYTSRPGAYVILVNSQGEVAIIDVEGRFHLPGGGIEGGESAIEAARRETLEEVGIEVSLEGPVGRANQYVYSTVEEQYFNKLCTYFLARVGVSCPPVHVSQHEAIWVQPDEACRRLDHESHAWAVEQVKQLLPTSPPGRLPGADQGYL